MGYGAGRAVWSPRDQVSLARNGYERNVIGFRAVRMVAEAAAAIPLALAEGGERMGEHPVAAACWRGRTPARTGGAFWRLSTGSCSSPGTPMSRASARDGRGWPRELHALRPDRMRVVPGPDGWPMAYEYVVGGAKHRWSMEGDEKPILHLKAFHPLDDHYGMSPLEAAAAAVDIHNAAASLGEGAARQRGAAVGGDRLCRQGRRVAAGGRLSAAAARDRGEPCRRTQCRPADAARWRARLEADGLQPG